MAEISVLEDYLKVQYLSVPRYIFEEVVKTLPTLDALRLIRASLNDEFGSYISLQAASEIYLSITGRSPYVLRSKP